MLVDYTALCGTIDTRTKGGTMKFNYKTSTIEDVVKHILTVKPQSVQASKLHYQSKNENEVVEKIVKARLLARCERILLQQGNQNEDNG